MSNCTAHLPLALHHQGILRASSSEGSILCLSEDARNNGDDDDDDGGSGGGGGVGGGGGADDNDYHHHYDDDDGGSGNVNDCDQDELSTTVKSKNYSECNGSRPMDTTTVVWMGRCAIAAMLMLKTRNPHHQQQGLGSETDNLDDDLLL